MKRSRIICGRLLTTLLAILMFAGVIPAGFIMPVTVKADGGPAGDVIFNEPYGAPMPYTGAASLDWTKIDHKGYDTRAYTEAVTGTPYHIVFKDDDICFYGYDVPPYADSVFTDTTEIGGASFVMRPKIMNFHTFSETGFLFNGAFTKIGKNLYYTGYAVILKCGNVAGMLENDANSINKATLCLYYIENEAWNPDSFTPGNVATTRTLISVIKTGINNLDSTPYRVDIDIDKATRAFDVYIDGLLRASIPASDVKGGASGDCGQTTVI